MTHTHDEILSQPTVWTEVLSDFETQAAGLSRFWEQHSQVDALLFTGCGTTYYLAHSMASIFQALTGIPARACTASDIFLQPESCLSARQRTLLVDFSRSGESIETIQAVETFRQKQGSAVLTFTCTPGSSLARLADWTVSAEAARERSIAETRSFTSQALLGCAFAALASGLDWHVLLSLPALCQRLLDEQSRLIEYLAADGQIRQCHFLAGGELYGMACEAMIKMKEMPLCPSEAFHPLEFRHGPVALIDPGSLVIGLVGAGRELPEFNLLRHLRGLGARVWAMAETFESPSMDAYHWGTSLNSGLPWWARPPLYLPLLQLAACRRAEQNGLDPDAPRNLNPVVTKLI
jgi:glucosamine--fructose-6-phosphate aminotransferase (isomerizing)